MTAYRSGVGALVYGVILSTLAAIALGAPQPVKQSPFDVGKRQFESGNHFRALDLFAQAISGGDANTRNKAYYYQGLAYFELGLYYSSYLSFKNVLLSPSDQSREVYEKAIKNSVIIADKLSMVDRVGAVIEKLPSQFIATSVSGTAHYAVGVYKMASGNDSEALSHLKSVAPESQFYDKALFNLGILSTKRKEYKEATVYFEKLIDITAGKRDLFWLNELARLNLARNVYSAGDIDRSIELYSQFVSSSPHWLTVLLEASWPLMRVNDTTVSLGNLHTLTSPFFREELVGEAYILRATILFSLCKYEEMRRTLAQFFQIYDPIVNAMESERNSLGSAEAYYRAYTSGKGLNRSFMLFLKRDEGIKNSLKVIDLLRKERTDLARLPKNEQTSRMGREVEEAEQKQGLDLGKDIQGLHKRKLTELQQQREQANYLKVEIVTGEKELIEGQKGLPPKRLVDVETSVAPGYHFWPYTGEFWEDELGTYIYTTESACVK